MLCHVMSCYVTSYHSISHHIKKDVLVEDMDMDMDKDRQQQAHVGQMYDENIDRWMSRTRRGP